MNPKVTIIGGGPAGIAAAIQLKRYDFEPILFEKNELGGLLKNANLVENYPGFPGGISGLELVERLKAHIAAYNINIKFEQVKQLDFLLTPGKNLPEKQTFSSLRSGTERPVTPGAVSATRFVLTTCSSSYYADVAVVAGGTKPKKSDLVESLAPTLRENIFYEVYPILQEKGKRILIIGAGDAAFDYALNLSRFNEVVILNRTVRIKALPLLVNRVKKSAGIEYLANTKITAVEKGREKKLLVTFTKEKSDKKIEADYLLCALGRETQKDFFTKGLWSIEKKLINQGRLHFAGDVKNGNFRQAAIAVGNGIESAMRIHNDYGVKT
jgi:thioredoxin reductase